MLLKQKTLAGVKSGAVSLAFRRWKRPTVKSGGTLLTSIGQLSIIAVEEVELGDISAQDATAAGFDDLTSLLEVLSQRSAGSVYRVRLAFQGADPRVALRGEIPDDDEARRIVDKLAGMDARSDAAWTRAVLRLIDDRSGQRAGDLAPLVGMEKAVFKANVRKLKALGLTESLKVGYRLSARGLAVMQAL